MNREVSTGAGRLLPERDPRRSLPRSPRAGEDKRRRHNSQGFPCDGVIKVVVSSQLRGAVTPQRTGTSLARGSSPEAQRNPTSLLRFVSWFLLRARARTLSTRLLFQLPPRITRVITRGESLSTPLRPGRTRARGAAAPSLSSARSPRGPSGRAWPETRRERARPRASLRARGASRASSRPVARSYA